MLKRDYATNLYKEIKVIRRLCYVFSRINGRTAESRGTPSRVALTKKSHSATIPKIISGIRLDSARTFTSTRLGEPWRFQEIWPYFRPGLSALVY